MGGGDYGKRYRISITDFTVDYYPRSHMQISRTPRKFAAALLFTDNAGTSTWDLAVNHPATHKGWRFYLASYEEQPRLYVLLTARRDPGRGTVIAGIWLLIVGVALLCLRKHRGPELITMDAPRG